MSLNLNSQRAYVFIGGNGCTSSFLLKKTETCHTFNGKYSKVESCFETLGSQTDLAIEREIQVEVYVCNLNGFSIRNVSIARLKQFDQKHKKNIKVQIGVLLPCDKVLHYHFITANKLIHGLYMETMVT